jgi:hypothetical protein
MMMWVMTGGNDNGDDDDYDDGDDVNPKPL